MTASPVAPVRFYPALERPSPKEPEAIEGLEKALKSILDTTSRDYGHAVRAVHAKGHGIVTGTLEILPNLPAELAQGLFAAPASYEAILRFSTAPGDLLDDSVSAPRGVGLKVLGVPGERLPDADGADQDFLLVNGPTFGAPDPATFLPNLKLLATTTDKAEGLKKAWSATMRTLEGALEAVGGKSVLLSTLGGAPEVHPLGETYFSQTAFRYGDYVAKFALKPLSPELRQRTGEKVNAAGRPDALREDVREVLIEHGGMWQLCVQLCLDAEAMPVENPTVEWDQARSPFRPVALLRVEPQLAWENRTSEAREDRLAFSPWHGLAAHQPLGAVNRARKPAYEFGAGYREAVNGCPMHGVRGLADLDA